MGSEQSYQAGSSGTDANGETANVGNGLPILLDKGGDKSNVDERDLYDNRDEESFGIFGKNVALLVETLKMILKLLVIFKNKLALGFQAPLNLLI